MAKIVVKLDAVTSAYLVHRYLAKCSHKIYSPKLYYKKGRRYQKIAKEWVDYKIQWLNIWQDIKYFFGSLSPANPARLFYFRRGAVAFDTATNNSVSSGSNTETSLTATHTAGGSDRYAIGGFSSRAAPTQHTTSFTMTYDGTSMSDLASQLDNANTDTRMFGLLNPSTTAGASVTASWSTAQRFAALGVVTFTGAGSVGTPVNTSVASGTSIQVTVATSSTGMVIDTFTTSGGPPNTSTQTERWNLNVGSGNLEAGGATAAGTGGDVIMKWSISAADNLEQIAVEVKAPAAVVSNPSNLLLMGVG